MRVRNSIGITNNKISHPHVAVFDVIEGDFSEVPEDCPATTTCPVVCVANVTACPTVCEDGLKLCMTGNCEQDCTFWDNGNLENPCTCDAVPIACPKLVDLYTTCFDRFESFYDENTQCLKVQDDSLNRLSFIGPWFLACYFEIVAVSVFVVAWCFWNQKVSPVASSTTHVEIANEGSCGAWMQTGYKTHVIGSFIYVLVMFTFAAIQFLLLILTIFFYVQQGAITRWPPVFEDVVQVLKAFEIVWMVGIVWCFAFRYPSTGARALFLRRCEMSQATHVVVEAPIKSFCNNKGPSSVARIALMMWAPFDCFLRAIFSYPYNRPGLETILCRIDMDLETGTRSILHRMRRYVYDNETGGFAPSYVSVGTTLGDLLDQIDGLSLEEANLRRGKRGPNTIPVPKPTILRSIITEFSKSFYLYQNFMVWSWFSFWNYSL